jgi:hypothetical protein
MYVPLKRQRPDLGDEAFVRLHHPEARVEQWALIEESPGHSRRVPWGPYRVLVGDRELGYGPVVAGAWKDAAFAVSASLGR